jgi:hypothetical protein
MAFDSSGSIYAIGWHEAELSGSIPVGGHRQGDAWLTIKSEDNGESWQFVDHFMDREYDNFYENAGLAITVDVNDVVYTAGSMHISGFQDSGGYRACAFVRRSADRGSTWETVLVDGNPSVHGGGFSEISACAWGIWAYEQYQFDGTLSGSTKIYVGGTKYDGTRYKWTIWESDTGESGTFSVVNSYTHPSSSTSDADCAFCFTAPQDDLNNQFKGDFYVGGMMDGWYQGLRRYDESTGNWMTVAPYMPSMTEGNEGSWNLDGTIFDLKTRAVPLNPSGSQIFAAAYGYSGEEGMLWASVQSQPSGTDDFRCMIQTENWANGYVVSPIEPHFVGYTWVTVDVDDKGGVYFGQYDFSNPWNILYSENAAKLPVGTGPHWYFDFTGSFNSMLTASYGLFRAYDGFDPTGDGGGIIRLRTRTLEGESQVWVAGEISFEYGVVRKGTPKKIAEDIGPQMLATSINYVWEEQDRHPTALRVVPLEESVKLLNNIDEFPYSGPWSQMRTALGTKDGGKIGTNEDSIIQISHIGSVVKVFWPKQEDQNQLVRGFGDFSIGQRVGKLETSFAPGDVYDVTEFDHLTLYCYLVKQASGSLDNVEIVVERRPLKDTGFTIDQSIEYESSGSITVAKLKDIRYSKEVDYGDLSLKEIAYPIDIPLTNVKEVRISARHVNGQGEENKNLIVWGRLIKSDEET